MTGEPPELPWEVGGGGEAVLPVPEKVEVVKLGLEGVEP